MYNGGPFVKSFQILEQTDNNVDIPEVNIVGLKVEGFVLFINQ